MEKRKSKVVRTIKLKRNELCVSMTIKMKDDKSSLESSLELSQFESVMISVHVLDSNIDFKSH